MAIFSTIAAGIISAYSITSTLAIAGIYAASSAMALMTTRLIAKRAMKKAASGGDAGGRVQLPPATDNKIPVVYGKAFISGPIIDARLSDDQQTMFYVIALTEKTSNGTISYGDIYYDGKKVTFGSDGAGGTTRVVSLTTNNSGVPQVDTKIDGNLHIFLYTNGSGGSAGFNTSTPAHSIVPGWDSSYYMTACAFAVIRVKYNSDAGTTGLGSLLCQVINTEDGQSTGVYRPGTAIHDYLNNGVYGCAIPSNKIDVASLTELNAYSDELITYTNANGVGTSQQPRYRLNGVLDTSNNCLDNLQNLVDSCDSWLQYSEMTGKWKVVVNKPYPHTPFVVNSSNLTSGIQIVPIDLNDTFNELEVAYPNENIKDQTDYQTVYLSDYQSGVMSPNEPVNRLSINYPLINNAVQGKYLGIRRLLQSREDLVISFDLDYSGIQLEAGDVVQITHEVYGWTNKLFRLSQVTEQQLPNGTLGVSVSAFEYNTTIYNDLAIQNYVPAFNTGNLDPNVFDAPTAPVITLAPRANGATTSFNVSSNVPPNGTILYMDFNYGNTANVQEHLLYRTVQSSDGVPLTPSSTITINVDDIPAGNLFWSATARNEFAGRTSPASSMFDWVGPGIYTYDPGTDTGGITLPYLGGDVQQWLTDLELELANNEAALQELNDVTLPALENDLANTQIEIDNLNNNTLPNLQLQLNDTNANVNNNASNISYIEGVQIPALTLEIANNQNEIDILTGYFPITTTRISDNSITTPKLVANAVVANKIAAGSITSTKIAAGSVEAIHLTAGSVTTPALAAGSVISSTIESGAITSDKISANAVTAINIAANAVTTNKIAASAITGDKISANAVVATNIAANAITTNKIAASAITGDKISAANVITLSAQIANATVNTLQIAGHAVTVPTVGSGGGSGTVGGGSGGTVMSTSVGVSGLAAGQTAGIIATGTVSLYPSGGSTSTVTLYCYINGTPVSGSAVSLSSGGMNISTTGYLDVGNGTHSIVFVLFAAPAKAMSFDGTCTAFAGKR